jgi:hypothetical protein
MIGRLQRAVPDLASRVLLLPPEWHMGSACSGTGAGDIVTDVVARSLNQAFGTRIEAFVCVLRLPQLLAALAWNPEVVPKFSCESVKVKQDWLKATAISPDACIFTDVTTVMDDEKRECCVHSSCEGSECAVPGTSAKPARTRTPNLHLFQLPTLPRPQKLFGFIAGFSCKSYSKLNAAYKNNKNAMALAASGNKDRSSAGLT